MAGPGISPASRRWEGRGEEAHAFIPVRFVTSAPSIRRYALIAGTYFAGTHCRVRHALGALFGGAVGKDTSRVWRKVKSDWDTSNARSLAEEPMRAAHSRRHRSERAAGPGGATVAEVLRRGF